VSAESVPVSQNYRRLVVDEWNATDRDIVDSNLSDLFRLQAQATPDQPALVFGTRHLTYAQLARRVQRVASRLMEGGVGPGKVVAVAVPRSDDLVVAILAAVTSGAAYLPVDLTLPRDRIDYMLRNAQPSCVLVTPETDWPCGGDRPLIACAAGDERDRSEAADVLRRPTPVPLHPLEAAYIIYTSGSTGRPKGVAVSHLSIVNHLAWMQSEYQLEPGDRVLQKTPAGFDVSVWEFFWPLTTGATLVVAGSSIHQEPRVLGELIRAERITTVHFVPSMLSVFLDELERNPCPSLKRVISSGEALAPELCRRFAKCCGAALFNLYGPTEAAIDVTSWPCSAFADTQRVPIGSPVANTRAYVLDENLQPVPPDVRGELYLAGIQLARGYVNNPALTVQRFVACPFGKPGERMYRTGDLAWWNEHGELEYAGRADTQVKIAGVRVELSEIEAVLARHAAVSQAAVVVAKSDGSNARLEGFVTLSPSVDPGLHRLVRLLAQERHPEIVELSPGLPVCVLNEAEARFMYREIFKEAVYGMETGWLPEGACVFDVGANIGLFSLLIGLTTRDAKIYAFEPIPEVFDLLRQNMELYGLQVEAHRCGVADAAAEQAAFTFYPRVSLISGRHADADADGAALRAFARSEHGTTPVDEAALTELIDSRLEARQVHAPLITISQAIDEAAVTSIALLKVDVERSEVEVLAGIEDRHWPIIDRIVMEVHDVDGRLDLVCTCLTYRGFAVEARCTPGQEVLHTVTAVRPGVPRAPRAAGAPTQFPLRLSALLDAVRAQSADLLPTSMVPARITPLPELPLTVNGKLDRTRLVARGSKQRTPGATPRTETERAVCALMASVLGVESVFLDEDFFSIGGTSIAAVRLTSALNQQLGVDVRLRAVLANPSAARLARVVEQSKSETDQVRPGISTRGDPMNSPRTAR
jgi:amino acid adenylation domain-containing protein/FkbM family methyltransferase